MSAQQSSAQAYSSLPTRAEFVEQLSQFRSIDGQLVTSACGGCHNALVNRSIDDTTTDTKITLPCQDVVGERCARIWFHEHSICPICGTVLFREQPDVDDVTNLRRICDLQLCQRYYDNQDDRAKSLMFYELSQQLIEACSAAFWSDGTAIIPAEYGLYRYVDGFDVNKLCQKPRTVRAGPLIRALCIQWDKMFVTASHSIVRNMHVAKEDLDLDYQVDHLTAPCHPLAAKLREQMVDILQSLDGLKFNRHELRYNLSARFSTSHLQRRLNEMDAINASPHGFYLYHRQLMECVLRAFVCLKVASEHCELD